MQTLDKRKYGPWIPFVTQAMLELEYPISCSFPDANGNVRVLSSTNELLYEGHIIGYNDFAGKYYRALSRSMELRNDVMSLNWYRIYISPSGERHIAMSLIVHTGTDLYNKLVRFHMRNKLTDDLYGRSREEILNYTQGNEAAADDILFGHSQITGELRPEHAPFVLFDIYALGELETLPCNGWEAVDTGATITISGCEYPLVTAKTDVALVSPIPGVAVVNDTKFVKKVVNGSCMIEPHDIVSRRLRGCNTNDINDVDIDTPVTHIHLNSDKLDARSDNVIVGVQSTVCQTEQHDKLSIMVDAETRAMLLEAGIIPAMVESRTEVYSEHTGSDRDRERKRRDIEEELASSNLIAAIAGSRQRKIIKIKH